MSEFDKTIPLELSKLVLKKLDNEDVVAYYQINKPSDLPLVAQLPKKNQPEVCLDLKEAVPELCIMNLRHPNILRVEAIEKVKKPSLNRDIAIFVEPHDGPLTLYLIKLALFENYTKAVPTQALRVVARQFVVAIEELRINGFYHGNLTIHSVYHSRDAGAIIVKLANFRKIDIALENAQLQDWVCLGSILRAISSAAKFRDSGARCSIIDRLASKLESLVDVTCLPRIKEETLNDVFFWDTRRRTMFFIHEIPKALKDDDFVQRVNNHEWILPWDTHPHGGLIEAMNKHREEIAIKEKHNGVNPGDAVLETSHYNGSDPIENIRCMSGAYTHQEKLVGKIVDEQGNPITVDAAIQKNQPDLCLDLVRLLAGEVF